MRARRRETAFLPLSLTVLHGLFADFLKVVVSRHTLRSMGTFSVKYLSGREERFEADDFDDDGDIITLFAYSPPGGDPLDPDTTKFAVAQFRRDEIVGPPLPMQ